jgi:hypothetical protein
LFRLGSTADVEKISRTATEKINDMYNDASHFSREYKGLFGEPPMRDVERLREVTGKISAAA